MRPMVSYYGGKQMIVNKIIELLPPHLNYIEPFAGGLAVLFAKSYPKDNSRYQEVINDLNENLINLYRVAKDPITSKRFMELVSSTPYSHSEYKKAKFISKNGHHNRIIRAWATFVNLNMSFANKLNGGWGFGKIKNNTYGEPGNFKRRISDLEKIIERISHVYIENIDAIKLIKKWDSSQTLFYCDPPYIDTDQGHYKGYTEEDYKSLCETLESIEGSFILSSYHNNITPDHWPKIEIQTRMSAANMNIETIERIERSRTECLYIVDRSKSVRGSLKKYLWPANKNQFPLFE